MDMNEFCQVDPQISLIIQKLLQAYPDLTPMLDFENPYRFLIRVILSAQCTDAKVNEVSKVLFSGFPDPLAISQAPVAVVEKILYPTGFYKAKTKNIIATSQIILTKFQGKVPLEMENLVSLPGVGRKTANVLRAQVGGFPAIIVDTHFKRVVRRLGLTDQQEPEKIETELLKIIPQEVQFPFSMAVNNHGRQICQARTPQCDKCLLQKLCPSG